MLGKAYKLFCLLVLGVFVFHAPASAEEFGRVAIGNWGFKAGVNERFRYEYKHNFDFSKSSKDSGSLFFNRFIVNAKATLGDNQGKDKIVIFLEGLDAQVGGYQLKPAKNQKDGFDLHQAYVDFCNILDSVFDLKIGRQELKYGAGRLIAAPTWSNRIRSFDAVVLRYRPSELYVDLFFGADVKYDDDNFNYIQHKEKIMGIYGGYQANKNVPKIEFYFLPQRIKNATVKSTRYTAGARLQGEVPGKILYDIELPYQFGKINHKSIKAYAFHAGLSHVFRDMLWEPKMVFEYNQASGDKDPNDGVNNTFLPLYQTTHDPYGLMDFFRWENMREISLNVNLCVTNKLKLTPQVNFFWLMSTNDSWYDSTGAVLRTDSSGLRSHYAGQEVSLRASYEVNKNIKLESGYAHFFTGGYVKDSGANDDADWLYAQLAFKY
ncbi:MAG: alginate export family protein [Candidatus Omnitrophica bacterium]|nr:alginate export family protein [Candidatus Omnitrophota bacterium]